MPLYAGNATNSFPGLITLAGDLGGTATSPTVININGAVVPSAGSLVTGNVLQVTGSSALSYAAINLAGGSNYVTGVLPSSNQQSQTMGGDVSGTTDSAIVSKINGITVTGTPGTGDLLVATSSSAATWQTPTVPRISLKNNFLLMGA